MNYGFVKVGSAIPSLKVADCKYNAEQMLPIIADAGEKGVEILLFPELGITSCSCGDLYRSPTLLRGAQDALQTLLDATQSNNTIIVVGAPIATHDALLNCAIVMHRGKIVGAVPQYYTPTTGESSLKRWFASAADITTKQVEICGQQIALNKQQLFETPQCTFAIEFGSDLMAPVPPSTIMALNGADIILCLASHCEAAGKYDYIKNLCTMQSARCIGGYIYTSCGYGESSGDAVFAGNSFIAENGSLLAAGERFAIDNRTTISEIDIEKIRHDRRSDSAFADARRDYSSEAVVTTRIEQEPCSSTLERTFSAKPFIPEVGLKERCTEIFNIQAAGLAKRIAHTHAATCVIGISGGLDSTLALLVTAKAFDMLGKEHNEIIAITMPGFGTSSRTYNNAHKLMQSLGVTIREISIKAACIQHFADIEHDIDKHDVTYENSQARERTQILMDVANKLNGLVVGTGDLSELALGWATYNGDHMSMYGVNASVPKTLIQHIVREIAESSDDATTRETLLDIVDTPISPELTPADNQGNIKQKTEDLVGPYELHDFFLYHTLRNAYSPAKIYFLAQQSFDGAYDDDTIKKWLKTFCRRFFAQQFKRSCMPDGPKVGSCGLSPRGEWKMATDTCSALWLAECEAL